ncbi:uncharacterized protein LOC129891811 [Solanum dulcamara]|uniref:uncharacterized protein LOC129891811 n=1 Tax=Solanum dulcamara TaxID=45834 RepID=UPI0024851FE5|nr:uncharacterized protein LOC129891811 [Solanum dulcamara]
MIGITYASDSRKIWESLKEKFDKKNSVRTFYLHKEIAFLTQGSNTVSFYFSRLSDLWDEFDALIPPPTCNCETSRVFTKHKQKHRIFQLFTGLNDSYSRAKSQILMMQPLPSLNQIYALVMQKESQRSLTNVMLDLEIDETTALMTNKPAPNYRPKRSYLYCDFCKNPGHTRAVCRRLLGQTNERNFQYNKGHQHERGDYHCDRVSHYNRSKTKPQYHPKPADLCSDKVLGIGRDLGGRDLRGLYLIGIAQLLNSPLSVSNKVHHSTTTLSTVKDNATLNTWHRRLGHMPIAAIQKMKKIKTQYASIVKTLRTANGSEFNNPIVHEVLIAQGTIHQTTCVHTPQQNRVVEGRHRYILEIVRALRIPLSVLGHKSPFEIFFKTSPSLDHLKALGCLAYAVNVQKREKITARALPVVFMGYSGRAYPKNLPTIEPTTDIPSPPHSQLPNIEPPTIVQPPTSVLQLLR